MKLCTVYRYEQFVYIPSKTINRNKNSTVFDTMLTRSKFLMKNNYCYYCTSKLMKTYFRIEHI